MDYIKDESRQHETSFLNGHLQPTGCSQSQFREPPPPRRKLDSLRYGYRAYDMFSWYKYLDPDVQSIVSLTISLRHKFVKQISAKVTNTLLFFVEKM